MRVGLEPGIQACPVLGPECPLRELPGPSKSPPQQRGPGYLHGAGRGLMGTGDGQDRGPSASGAPEPLLTKLRTSGTLGAEAEQKQAVDGRHSRQNVTERAKRHRTAEKVTGVESQATARDLGGRGEEVTLGGTHRC